MAAEANAPLKEALAAQREENGLDCLPCRLMGSAVFTGLGIYTLSSGMSQIRQREAQLLKSGSALGVAARRANVFLFSGVLVGLGVYRLVN